MISLEDMINFVPFSKRDDKNEGASGIRNNDIIDSDNIKDDKKDKHVNNKTRKKFNPPLAISKPKIVSEHKLIDDLDSKKVLKDFDTKVLKSYITKGKPSVKRESGVKTLRIDNQSSFKKVKDVINKSVKDINESDSTVANKVSIDKKTVKIIDKNINMSYNKGIEEKFESETMNVKPTNEAGCKDNVLDILKSMKPTSNRLQGKHCDVVLSHDPPPTPSLRSAAFPQENSSSSFAREIIADIRLPWPETSVLSEAVLSPSFEDLNDQFCDSASPCEFPVAEETTNHDDSFNKNLPKTAEVCNITDSKSVCDDTVSYKCEKCGCKYSYLQSFFNHKANVNCEIFKCDKCDSTFKNIQNLKRHVRNTHTNLSIQCNFCPEQFPSVSKLNRHYQKKHVRVTCDFCHQEFNNKNTLRVHKQKCKKKKSSSGVESTSCDAEVNLPSNSKKCQAKPYSRVCEICHKILFSRSAYWKHRKTHRRNDNDDVMSNDVSSTGSADNILANCDEALIPGGSRTPIEGDLRQQIAALCYDQEEVIIEVVDETTSEKQLFEVPIIFL